MHNIPTDDHVLTGVISSQHGCYFVEEERARGVMCFDSRRRGEGSPLSHARRSWLLLGHFRPGKSRDFAFQGCSEIGADRNEAQNHRRRLAGSLIRNLAPSEAIRLCL